MRLADLGILVLLGAIWGASYLFIRVAVPPLGPFALVEVRVLVAGLSLLLYAAAIRQLPDFRQRWRQFLLLGAINSAAPFTLISAAELHVTAALAAIINATTPLFAALVAAAWMNERLTPRKAAGLVIGLVGVIAVVGWSPLVLDAPVLWSIAAMLAASLSYAVGGVYAARGFAGIPSLTMSIGQQLGAAAVLLVPAATRWPARWPGTGVTVAVAVLALVCTAFAYLLYFRLIRSVGPTRTMSVTFLVPVFGVFWGALFLGEAISAGTLAGLAIILAGIVLVSGIQWPAPAVRRAARTGGGRHL